MNHSNTVVIAIVAVLLTSAAAQREDSDFCGSRTTLAYHSPKCDWGWVVHDPNRVENLRIPHKPPYHTYSRWTLDDGRYVFAYRDIDQQPSDMAADIYLASDTHYKLIGSVQHLGEIVTGVFTARLTGAALPDVVFREDCGELQCIVVTRFSDKTAKQVFWYGATEIEITKEPTPMIIARSNISNLVEEFAWKSKAGTFVKTREYAWRKTQ